MKVMDKWFNLSVVFLKLIKPYYGQTMVIREEMCSPRFVALMRNQEMLRSKACHPCKPCIWPLCHDKVNHACLQHTERAFELRIIEEQFGLDPNEKRDSSHVPWFEQLLASTATSFRQVCTKSQNAAAKVEACSDIDIKNVTEIVA
jgi:hypothetical protein